MTIRSLESFIPELTYLVGRGLLGSTVFSMENNMERMMKENKEYQFSAFEFRAITNKKGGDSHLKNVYTSKHKADIICFVTIN